MQDLIGEVIVPSLIFRFFMSCQIIPALQADAQIRQGPESFIWRSLVHVVEAQR